MNELFLFDYDLHIHTSESSRCGHLSAADMTAAYVRLGYNGFAITDHFNTALFQMVQAEIPSYTWEQAADRFLLGYRNARASGEKLSFDVVLGAELRFPENNNDYLIYGMTEEFFYKEENRNFHLLGIQEFYRRFGKKFTIIQAHPYRDGNEKVFWQYLHGVEVLNKNERHENRNEKARELARRRGLIQTAGSDAHQPQDIGRCKISFSQSFGGSSRTLAQHLKEQRFRFSDNRLLNGTDTCLNMTT